MGVWDLGLTIEENWNKRCLNVLNIKGKLKKSQMLIVHKDRLKLVHYFLLNFYFRLLTPRHSVR